MFVAFKGDGPSGVSTVLATVYIAVTDKLVALSLHSQASHVVIMICPQFKFF